MNDSDNDDDLYQHCTQTSEQHRYDQLESVESAFMKNPVPRQLSRKFVILDRGPKSKRLFSLRRFASPQSLTRPFRKGIWFNRFLISPSFLLKIMKPFVSSCCFMLLIEVSWKFMWSSNSYGIHVCVSLCPRHLLCGDRYKLIKSDQSDQAPDCFLSWATYFVALPRGKIARFGKIILIIPDMNLVEIYRLK